MILEAILASRWLPRKEGWWCVAPGDDVSDWSLVGDLERVRSIFHSRLASGEPFGIRLWWEDSEVGGEFLVFPNCELVFSPTMNRVRLDGRATDVSWYIPKVLTIFGPGLGVAIDNWSWQETS